MWPKAPGEQKTFIRHYMPKDQRLSPRSLSRAGPFFGICRNFLECTGFEHPRPAQSSLLLHSHNSNLRLDLKRVLQRCRDGIQCHYLWQWDEDPQKNPVSRSSIGSRAKGSNRYPVFSGGSNGIQSAKIYGMIFEIQLGWQLLANYCINCATLKC